LSTRWVLATRSWIVGTRFAFVDTVFEATVV